MAEGGKLELPLIPEGCEHNAHMFYVKLEDLQQRTEFISYLRDHGVQSTFHYIPLHSSPAGKHYGRFAGMDEFTTRESNRLTRLPMYYGLSKEDRATVVDAIRSYFA